MGILDKLYKKHGDDLKQKLNQMNEDIQKWQRAFLIKNLKKI